MADMSIPDIDTALVSQRVITEEIEKIHAGAQAGQAQPRLDFVPYRSAILRHPARDLKVAVPDSAELVAPVFGPTDVDGLESDLTIGGPGDPIGERILVRGRIFDGDGRPVRRQLVEIWRANAAGRYIHQRDQHPAPLDPNFTGTGRALTDEQGWYSFTTIKPGPYPWHNHRNAWRPSHIHFSLFGTEFTERMITQMYFPGDPLFALDPIYQSITDERARARLVAAYDHDLSQHDHLLGYRWDIVLTGSRATLMEDGDA
jgi:protocatechuate 3,4-dioxygenase, beta subunit